MVIYRHKDKYYISKMRRIFEVSRSGNPYYMPQGSFLLSLQFGAVHLIMLFYFVSIASGSVHNCRFFSFILLPYQFKSYSYQI